MPEGTLHDTAYSNQAVILLLSSDKPQAYEITRRRLSRLFGVPHKSVRSSEASGICAYFIPGSYKDDFSPAIVSDESQFIASATPIFDHGIAGDATGERLADFTKRVFSSTTEHSNLPIPLSLFYAHFSSRHGYAVNDTFGMGRLYVNQGSGQAAASNNIAAVAVALDGKSEADLDFWDSYYTSGGGVGDKTYVSGVKRAPGGSTVHLAEGRVSVESTHSLESLLLESRDREPDYRLPVEAATRLMESAKPYFSDSLGIGLSGGRDSRLVTALALHAGLTFKSFTAVPPMLEADIARQLHKASTIPFDWEIRDSSQKTLDAKRTAETKIAELPPILERAESWFAFTGGDNWATHMRQAPVRRTPIPLRNMAPSGAFGDFTRGHYYTEKEAASDDHASAIARFHRSFVSIRKFIPTGIRVRGAAQIKETFDRMESAGIQGFSSLEFSFLVNRMRRQLPHPAPNTLLPMLTPQMLSEVFWNNPLKKLDAHGLRVMTSELMPEWSAVPYFHEAAVGTDPNVTNKVSIRPTYWEIDEGDFLESVEHSLKVNDYFHLDMDDVRKEITELPEGRNRTNTTFEFIFWHAGATALLDRVNRAKQIDTL